MAIKIFEEGEQDMGETKPAPRRLWFTKDKSELVPDDDLDAATLAASREGAPIPADVPIRGEKSRKVEVRNKAIDQTATGDKSTEPPVVVPDPKPKVATKKKAVKKKAAKKKTTKKKAKK